MTGPLTGLRRAVTTMIAQTVAIAVKAVSHNTDPDTFLTGHPRELEG
ncbi:hypothetical protein [Mycobacterium riyadhense]